MPYLWTVDSFYYAVENKENTRFLVRRLDDLGLDVDQRMFLVADRNLQL